MKNKIKYEKELNSIGYYRKEFIKYTSSEDILGIIVKGHLFIENELEQLINKALIRPLNIPNSTFSSKVELAYSLGLIEEDWIGAFRKLNSYRNKYAHNIDFDFTDNDYDDLISTFSKSAKIEFIKDMEAEEFLLEFKKSLNAEQKELSINLQHKVRVILANFWIYLKLNSIQINEILKIQNLNRELELLNKEIKIIEE